MQILYNLEDKMSIFDEETRGKLRNEITQNKDAIVRLCSELVQIPSFTPPSDTRAVANYIYEYLKDIPGVKIDFYEKKENIVNMIVQLDSGRPGKRLVFNGHMDTHVPGNGWEGSPFSGEVKDGFVYGRGASDMKGGLTCFLTAFRQMAEHRNLWKGTVVLTMVGDEEQGGRFGTEYLLREVPDARGDACICADVGAPTSLRFGQKGILNFTLRSTGIAAHGAHRHLGECAVSKMAEAICLLNRELPNMPVDAPEYVTRAIEEGTRVSEAVSGVGESEVLKKVTINFGVIQGGVNANLIPDDCVVHGDIRTPAGVTSRQIEEKINSLLAGKGFSFQFNQVCEASWSDLSNELFQIARRCSEEVLEQEVVVTYRIGASDARFYRYMGIPAINCGVTPRNMGGPQEHCSVEELVQISQVHLLTAIEYLQ